MAEIQVYGPLTRDPQSKVAAVVLAEALESHRWQRCIARIAVRSHMQFCQGGSSKDPRIHMFARPGAAAAASDACLQPELQPGIVKGR